MQFTGGSGPNMGLGDPIPDGNGGFYRFRENQKLPIVFSIERATALIAFQPAPEDHPPRSPASADSGPLGRVIFDHHNGVHNKVLLPGR
jgi:hypothetical protein